MSEARGEERRADRVTGRPGDGKVHKLISRALYPADKVVIAYLVIVTALILIFSHRIQLWPWLCIAHAIGIGFVVLVAWQDRKSSVSLHSPRGAPLSGRVAPSLAPPLTQSSSPVSPSLRLARFIHGWYPVALITMTFKELGYLIPRIHPRDFDVALAAIDHRVFGVHPTVWLERFMWPPLTELLQICYPTYYVLPIILGAVIWRSGDAEGFRFWVFVVVLGFYLSYLGYIAVPAIGPRFLPLILEAQTRPLTGVLFYQTVRDALDRAEGLTRDCFPSGHTEMTLLALYYARRFHRKTFRVLLPLGIAIIISTVYLRYHYVVDLAAGTLLAGVVILSARRVFAALGGNNQAHQGAQECG